MQFEKFRPNLKILRLVGELDEFKGFWSAFSNIPSESLVTLKQIATIESIASSARIEGVSLTNDQVETLLSKKKTYSLASADEEEVIGYAEVLETIFKDWQQVSLTESHIKQLHALLLKYSTKDKMHRGHYKTLPNQVSAFDHKGKSMGAVFEAVSPFDAPFRMTELINWTNESLRIGDLHPLLVIAVFDLVFLAIHPFQHGNGRLCRAITTLLLLKAGYAYVPYSSLESAIEANKEGYYLALRQTQTTLVQDEPDWQAWILFFLQCMQKQKIALQAKIRRDHFFEDELPLLSLRILEIARENGRTKIAEIENLTGESRSTIKIRLNELIKQNRLERHGRGPATWYSPAKQGV